MMQTIVANGQKFDLFHTTGKVEEAGKNMETKITGSGGGGFIYRGTGGNAPISIKSKTVVHDQFFITDDTGNEHSFQLQNFNVACRTGNRLSVVWAVRQGKKKGPYIMVYNHSTSSAYYNSKSMAKLFRRPVLFLIGIEILLLLLGTTAGFFYWLIPVAFGYWALEGTIAANRVKKQVDINHLSTVSAQQTSIKNQENAFPAKEG